MSGITQSKKAERSKFALNVVVALLVVGVAAVPVLVLLVAAEWRVFNESNCRISVVVFRSGAGS